LESRTGGFSKLWKISRRDFPRLGQILPAFSKPWKNGAALFQTLESAEFFPLGGGGGRE
jgi:hypothetical protein